MECQNSLKASPNLFAERGVSVCTIAKVTGPPASRRIGGVEASRIVCPLAVESKVQYALLRILLDRSIDRICTQVCTYDILAGLVSGRATGEVAEEGERERAEEGEGFRQGNKYR